MADASTTMETKAESTPEPGHQWGDEVFTAALKKAQECRWSKRLPVDEFIAQSGVGFDFNTPDATACAKCAPVIDVRSPIEFDKGHIPGSVNIPLFSNEQRAHVGKVFKSNGKEGAVRVGIRHVQERWRDYLTAAQLVQKRNPDGPLYVCCFRGGMRSGSLAFLLEEAGMKAVVLDGGYKGFRQWCLGSFASVPLQLCVVSGRTGVGKTGILLGLRQLGEQVLDLEGEAKHLGSAFGHLPQPKGFDSQPTTEMFQNQCAVQWRQFDPDRLVYIEDESQNCGNCSIPKDLMQRKHEALYLVEVTLPVEDRVVRLCDIYGTASKEDLIGTVKRLHKKFGAQRVAEFERAVEADDLAAASRIALDYYDRLYDRFLTGKVHAAGRLTVATTGQDVCAHARRVLDVVNEHMQRVVEEKDKDRAMRRVVEEKDKDRESRDSGPVQRRVGGGAYSDSGQLSPSLEKSGLGQKGRGAVLSSVCIVLMLLLVVVRLFPR